MPGGARCYACEIGHAQRQNDLGRPNEPVGSCYNCQAFACGLHGYRDNGTAEFNCVMCDPNLLAASAAAIAQSQLFGDLDQSVIADFLALYRPKVAVLPPFLPYIQLPYVRSIEEFISRRPYYGDEFINTVSNTYAKWKEVKDERLRETILKFPGDTLLLLRAAGFLVKISKVEKKYPSILQEIARVVHNRNIS